MKHKAQHQILTALILATLLVAGSFWAKISLENRSQTVDSQQVMGRSVIDAARQVLSTLPATTVQKAGAVSPVKP